MRNRSVKRAKQEREYSKLRDKFLQANPYCQAMIQCHGLLATEIHHKKGKIQGLLTDTDYFLSVCRTCHQWIENNPLEAKELGLSLSRLSK
jgi:hypothetical protein